MNVFISGGAKNGKSMFAQRAAKEMAEEKGAPLYYVATMIPHDEEDEARIARHIRAREGWGFTTVEAGRDICGVLDEADPDGVFLLDSVTALLANEMFSKDGYDPGAGEKVAEELAEFARRTGNTVFVSDYIYSDAARYDEMTENYRRALAAADRRLARVCDRVAEVSCGTVIFHKGDKI